MTIKEFFTVDNGLFETIFEPNFPVLYKSIFGEDDPKQIDIDLLFKYGNRQLVDAVTKETATDILKFFLICLGFFSSTSTNIFLFLNMKNQNF